MSVPVRYQDQLITQLLISLNLDPSCCVGKPLLLTLSCFRCVVNSMHFLAECAVTTLINRLFVGAIQTVIRAA